MFVVVFEEKAGGRENSSQASSRFFRNRVFCSRQNQPPSWLDNNIDWQPVNMFARNIGSAAARNALRTGLRFSSSIPARSDPPRAWTPIPYITETIVCPPPFSHVFLLTIQGGGWRTSDIFSKLLQERIICLNGEVNETLSAAIVAQLLYLESDAPEKAITLYINSPGGSVTAGLAIYDTMTYIRSPVSTVCVGQAASMGSLLLCGGEKGKRFCLPHSSVMVHQPSGGYFGQASDIAIHAQEILRVRRKLNEIFRRHLTKEHTLDDIERLMERDKFLSAEEALEMGIVDEILDRRIKDEEKTDGSTT